MTTARRVLVYGCAGSGKTTMATSLAEERGLVHLDLDSITWEKKLERRALPATLALLDGFLAQHDAWVIEGCYGDVIQAAAPRCSELVFLNPGVEACVANCRRRPWEPSKYASAAEQDELLEALIAWVRDYETRDDEYGLAKHRAVFDAHAGAKREVTGSSNPR